MEIYANDTHRLELHGNLTAIYNTHEALRIQC